MTTKQLLAAVVQSGTDTAPAPSAAVRVSLRQPVSRAGFIDAAWWPRGRDLTTELPPLMGALWAAGREVTRITYNLAAWDPAPRRIRIDGRTVRLGGFATSDPITVRLSDAWGRERIDMLVIAPDTEPAVAERALLIASRTGDPCRAGEILAHATNTENYEPSTRS